MSLHEEMHLLVCEALRGRGWTDDAIDVRHDYDEQVWTPTMSQGKKSVWFRADVARSHLGRVVILRQLRTMVRRFNPCRRPRFRMTVLIRTEAPKVLEGTWGCTAGELRCVLLSRTDHLKGVMKALQQKLTQITAAEHDRMVKLIANASVKDNKLVTFNTRNVIPMVSIEFVMFTTQRGLHIKERLYYVVLSTAKLSGPGHRTCL